MKLVKFDYSDCGIAKIASIAVILSLSVAPSYAAKKSTPSTSATYDIREKCVAKAQAAYPDNGLGTQTVMSQRTAVYASCAKQNGIRP